MSNLLFFLASLLGAAAIVWMGADFAGTNTLAFAVTACIGGVYLIGIIEMLRFRRATTSLSNALATITVQTTATPEWLEEWLQRLDPSLYASVRARIVGERTGLPTPAFTPYLVGLLVMLGLLGTFVGMVDTLGGAVSALRGSTELDAIRASLTAPIQGLGVAFGTSVAGVAASAMLGLISTLVRHHRIMVTRQLDAKIATAFSEFSLGHQRQRAFDALQSQAGALPAVASELRAVATQLSLMGDKLGETLLSNQQQFHAATGQRFSELATSVDQSLRDSLAASGKAAGESLQPVLTTAVAEISQLLQETQQQQGLAAHNQLKALGDEFGVSSTSVLEAFSTTSSSWTEQTLALQDNLKETLSESVRELSDNARASTTRMLAEIGGLLESTQALVQSRTTSEAAWLDSREATEAALLDSQGQRLEQLTAAVTEQLSTLQAQEEQGQVAAFARQEQLTATVTAQLDALRAQEERGQLAAVARLSDLESMVATHLTQLGKGLEAPMTRLIETASETPRAAAEVIGLLRAEITNNVERDNQLLEERLTVMRDLKALSESLQASASGQRDAVENLVTSSTALLQETASGQRSAVESLVASSTTLMQETTSQFGDHLLAEVSKISEASAHVAGGAIELSSLGEAFGLAVNLFNNSNEAMMEHLARVEEAMAQSSNRSDEQMGYYVAQAREIIDHSMLSQKEIMEDMQRINRKSSQQANGA